jgi:hypothetical protein
LHEYAVDGTTSVPIESAIAVSPQTR